MHPAIEIDKPLVAALRKSEALPNTHNEGSGKMYLLYADGFHPVGYMVEKLCPEDAWESMDPRFFITSSHGDALRLLATPFAELPAREATAS